MTRRRLVAVAVAVAVGAVAVLARFLAPERYDAAVGVGTGIVERTPDPVIVGLAVLTVVVLGVVLLVYLARLYYWAWLQVETPVNRLWDAALPESPIVRVGVGLTIMVFVFLIGPLVALQALDVFDDDDEPIDDPHQNASDEDPDDAGEGNVSEGTSGNHTDDDPDSPDEPPDENG